MTELAMRSTSGTDPVAIEPGCRIAAVRADGGAVEILGRDAASGAQRRWRIGPTDRDLGWVVPPEDAVWTAFRALGHGATCFVELAPCGSGALAEAEPAVRHDASRRGP